MFSSSQKLHSNFLGHRAGGISMFKKLNKLIFSNYYQLISMDLQHINWRELKRNSYFIWRDELTNRTLELLTNSSKVDLSVYNHYGYFHRVRNIEHFEQMKQDWQNLCRVPQEWIVKGDYPGIWTAMFNPHNTYSVSVGPPRIARFYFQDGYFIYDSANPDHKNLWENWQNISQPNVWENIKCENKKSLKQKIEETLLLPSHKKFFEEYRFGGVIGYSDYIAPVIFLEDSIERVDFLEL